jgi:hypothetical protein
MRRSGLRRAIPASAGLLSLVACLGVPVEPQDHEARADPYYAELDRIAEEGGQLAILEGITQRRKAPDARSTDVRVELQWLKDRVRAKLDPDPFYALHYSDLAFGVAQGMARAGDEQADVLHVASLVMLSMFEAVAVIDAARCDDGTVPERVRFLVAGRYAHFRELMPTLPSDARARAKRFALDHEESLARRPPNAAICRSGMAAMQAALRDPDHTEEIVDDPGVVGGKRTMIRPSKPYAPEFVGDEVWSARRAEIREALLAR